MRISLAWLLALARFRLAFWRRMRRLVILFMIPLRYAVALSQPVAGP
jgi:hypothetical protein